MACEYLGTNQSGTGSNTDSGIDMFSYYGLAASALLSLLNYIFLGLAFNIDGFYMHSFEIWLACTVVFPGAGNIGYTLLEYRLGQRSIISSFLENITWIPFL
jgi:hypothetical protein